MTIDEAVQRAYPIPGMCHPTELGWLYRRALRTAPAVHVEVGSYCGRSLWAFCAGLGTARKGKHTVFAVEPELPESMDVKTPGPDWVWKQLSLTIECIHAAFPTVRVHQVNRTSKEFFDSVAKDGWKCDSVYIDANHNYAECKDDIERWLSVVRPGGWIAGHDFDARFPGVQDAVHEVFEGDFKLHSPGYSRIWYHDVRA